MNAQEQAATAVMKDWLSHPDELGKLPAKLEIAGTFDLHGLRSFGGGRGAAGRKRDNP